MSVFPVDDVVCVCGAVARVTTTPLDSRRATMFAVTCDHPKLPPDARRRYGTTSTTVAVTDKAINRHATIGQQISLLGGQKLGEGTDLDRAMSRRTNKMRAISWEGVVVGDVLSGPVVRDKRTLVKAADFCVVLAWCREDGGVRATIRRLHDDGVFVVTHGLAERARVVADAEDTGGDPDAWVSARDDLQALTP